MTDSRVPQSRTAFAPSPVCRGGLGRGAFDRGRIEKPEHPLPASPCEQGEEQSCRRAKS